jgi:hypothetical protein
VVVVVVVGSEDGTVVLGCVGTDAVAPVTFVGLDPHEESPAGMTKKAAMQMVRQRLRTGYINTGWKRW